MPATPPVFVAGTGRSGTSQLADIIGEHPQIHRVPIETHVVDGIYGPQTAGAVARFQSDHWLDVDGNVGPKTYSMLQSK